VSTANRKQVYEELGCIFAACYTCNKSS